MRALLLSSCLVGCAASEPSITLTPSVVTRDESARTYRIEGLPASSYLVLSSLGLEPAPDLRTSLGGDPVEVSVAAPDHVEIWRSMRLEVGVYDVMVHARGRDYRRRDALRVIDDGTDVGMDAMTDATGTDALTPLDGGEDGGDGGGDGADVPLDAGVPQHCLASTEIVACWPLESDGLDVGPLGNDLTVGGVTFVPMEGAQLGALSTLSRASASLDASNVSLTAWVFLDALPSGSERMGVLDSDGSYGIFIHAGGEVRCNIARPSSSTVMGSIPLDVGSWHHLACVGDAGETVLYVDGASAGSTSSGARFSEPSSGVHVGADDPGGGDVLEGRLCSVAIYDDVLSAAAVAADFARGRP
jgi:Concanavalin A-like lectin/glucanases superfamily